MSSRSRKRRRRPAVAAATAGATVAPAEPEQPPEVERSPEPEPPPEPEPERRPEPEPGSQSAAPPTSTESLRRGYARSRERDDTLRANLEPLAPGERPRSVTIAAIVALVFALANVAAALAGADLSAEEENPETLTAVTSAILLGAAIGMWLRRYWAVLAFEVILALQIIVLSLALVRVQKWWLGLGIVIVIGLLTWLFWKLIRAMARLQMPARPEPRPSEPTQ